MKWAFLILVIVGVLWGVGRIWFASVSHGVEATLRKTSPGIASPPDIIRNAALAGQAVPGDLATVVVIDQTAEMRLSRGGDWQPLQARQVIATGAPGFVWTARQGLAAAPKVAVLDTFSGGYGSLQVWLGGALRSANAKGPLLDEAEAMRYLAELPWAPDAILGNPDIVWTDLGGGKVLAELPTANAQVTLTLTDGRITDIFATGRPATDEDGADVRMDWRGQFSDYEMIGGRSVPRFAQVGYVWPDGKFELYFRGEITSYQVFHQD